MNKEELFEKNIILVHFVINKFFKKHYENEDVIQSGYLGLWKACKYFNEKKGIKFSSFAVPCIKNEINLYLRREKKHYGLVSLEDLKTDLIFEEPDNDFSIIEMFKSNQKDYAKLLASGLTNAECCKCLSLSRQALSVKRKEMKNILETQILSLVGN